MPSILNTGLSALTAFQQQMSVTGHNIANATTEGYSRQNADMSAQLPMGTGAGYIGRGVEVTTVRRSYDAFVGNQFRQYASGLEEFDLYHSLSVQIENVISDPDAGLNNSLNRFFDAVQDVADDPTSLPAREVMLNNSNVLVNRFHSLNGWLQDLQRQTNANLESYASEDSTLANNIAKVNDQIRVAMGAFSGQPPNDLLDQRDLLLDELSKLVSVTAIPQDDGMMNVFIGTGQNLVSGNIASQLVVAQNTLDPTERDILLQQPDGTRVNVTDVLTGGKIGGIQAFRDEILGQTMDDLGLLAIGISQAFNDEHLSGMNLDGLLGQNYFQVAAPEVSTGVVPPGVAVSITDISQLEATGYDLRFNGASWLITDQQTGATTNLGNPGVPGTISFNGLQLDITSQAAGDRYLVRPVRRGAADIGLLVSNPRDIAAAEPVTMEPPLPPAAPNTGTASISNAALVQTYSPASKLAAPIDISFDGVNLNIAGAQFLDGAGLPVASMSYTAGTEYRVDIVGLGEYRFTMTGAPAAGDSFQIRDNTGSVGDNRNALRLAQLQIRGILNGGQSSFSDAYNASIVSVGSEVRESGNNAEVQRRLWDQSLAHKEEISGVNLDEEAANLLRFQQAYQAASQVIAVSSTLFDTLLNAVRS